jgi:hypothetical protein
MSTEGTRSTPRRFVARLRPHAPSAVPARSRISTEARFTALAAPPPPHGCEICGFSTAASRGHPEAVDAKECVDAPHNCACKEAAVNTAFLLISSAALAGADPMPAPHPAAVVVSGTGCSNCAPASDCCSKAGLFDRIKGRLGGRKAHDCGAPACAPAPAPVPCAPACAPAPCGPKSCADRPNLLDTLKARWGSKHGPCCDPCGATHVSGCAAPLPAGAAPVVPGTGAPKEMPKPKDKEPVKGNLTSAPVAPTVNGAGLTRPTSPY